MTKRFGASVHWKSRKRLSCFRLAVLGGVAALLSVSAASTAAQAMEIDTGNPDIRVQWTNTFKYSTAFRVGKISNDVTANINADDGDRAFKQWKPISNRVDWLSELNITNASQTFGGRVSFAAWYDTIYNKSNYNNSASTYNQPPGSPADRFTNDTERLMGRKIDLLDAFVFGRGDLFGHFASFRLGRHTLMWGESLLIPYNGIAHGQAPLDAIKAAAVPSSTAKELFMPVTQASGSFQIMPGLNLAAYYQFEWRETRLPASGSYFSPTDNLGAGASRVFLSPGFAISRGGDIEGSDSGQYGVSLRWTPEDSDYTFGLYAIRYNEKTPTAYINLNAAFTPTSYQLVYPDDVKAYGASVSTTILDANVAMEGSIRQDTPLVSLGSTVLPGVTADNDNNALYPTGNSAHLQASVIAVLPQPALWDTSTLQAEVAADHLIEVKKNAVNYDSSGRTRNAGTLAAIFTPTYFGVFPGLDLDVPITVHYNFAGKSSISANMTEGSSDVSVGLNATYDTVWRAGLSYTHYMGDDPGLSDPTLGQALKDRDFISFNIQRSF